MSIDIGTPAIVRPYIHGGGPLTLIVKENPANEGGIITSIEIYVTVDSLDVVAATFTKVGTNSFTARDSYPVGTVLAGAKRTFSVSLNVQAGDYLGIYASYHNIYATASGEGFWIKGGDQTTCINKGFNPISGWTLSIYGSGSTGAVTSVGTLDAYSVTPYSAYLAGRITLIGGVGNCTRRGFRYGKTTGYGSDVHEDGSFGSGDYALQVTGLDEGETYHFQAYVIDANDDEQVGEDKTFSYEKTSWNIATLTYANKVIVMGLDTPGSKFFMKPDGTKLYVGGGRDPDVIRQYSLSTPHDIDTAVYEKSGDPSETTRCGVISHKPNGTKVYVVGGNDVVYQYTLTAPWDINTLNYDGKSFDMSGQDGQIRLIVFKPDGTKVYALGGLTKRIYQYSLSTAWDINTASYDNKSYSIDPYDNNTKAIVFPPNGTKLYCLGQENMRIYQHSLSTAWDVSTASYDNVSASVHSQLVNLTCMFIDTDGVRVYVGGFYDVWGQHNPIHQYALVPDAPTDIIATSGEHMDKVAITWEKSEGATAYQVYRDNVALGWLGDVDTYDDTGAGAPTIVHGSVTASDGSSTANVALSNIGASANNGTVHTYKVKAKNAAGESNDSVTDTGFRGQVSVLTYQWYRSAGDSDANYSIISGATESTYNDVGAPAPTITPGSAAASNGVSAAHVALSLSGQSAAVGDGRYYKCYHTATGAAAGYTAANRGYRGVGSLTYQWQRSPDDIDVGHSNISGATSASYNDTGAPADGSGRYYRCVENATGAAQQISTTNRGYRMYAPTVVTQAASSLTGVSATLNGNITDAGGPITTRGFKYYKDGEPGNVLDVHEDGTFEEGVYGLGISSLVNGTKYYFRAYATNDAGTSYGSWLDFTTEVYLPLVTTESPSDIGIDHAKGNGTIVSGANITERGFEVVLAFSGSLQEYTDHKMAGFAGTATYNSATKKWEGTLTKTITETGTFGAGAFTGNIGAFPTALPSDKIFGGEVYIYKARATNDVGVGYGSWVLLTALSYPTGGGPDDQIPIVDFIPIVPLGFEFPEFTYPDIPPYSGSWLGAFYYRKAYSKKDLDELRRKCKIFQDNIVEYALVINHNSRVLQRFLNDLTINTGADEYNTFRPIIPPQHLNALARRPLSVGDFKTIINSFINNSVDNANNVNNNFRLIRGGLSDYTYTEDEGFVDISIRTKIITDNKPDVEGLTKVINRLNKEMADNYLVINHNSHVLRSILI